VPTPDVVITPVIPAGPSVSFGLAGVAKSGQYITGSYTWVAVDRPRRKPFLEWTSDQLKQLDLPLLLDGADTNTSIEDAAAMVNSWTSPTESTGQPPILAVSGPVELQGVGMWALQTLTWGDAAVIRRSDGDRTQQDLSLLLLEYDPVVAPDTPSPTLTAQVGAVLAVLNQSGLTVPGQLTAALQQLPSLAGQLPAGVAAELATQLSAFLAVVPTTATDAARVVNAALPQLAQVLPLLAGSRTYVVRDGDSLARIAARELGDYRKAGLIATLNGIRDPRSIRRNDVLQLP
jgi:nucleoid-associated protein YgaU